jgi:TP901 family phage tail tape measure protein
VTFPVGSLVAYLTVDGAATAAAEISDVQRSMDMTGASATRMGAATDAGFTAATAGASKLTVAQLRATAASEKYNALLARTTASSGELAVAEAAVAKATAQAALAQERLDGLRVGGEGGASVAALANAQADVAAATARATVAEERLTAVQSDGVASTQALASSEATLIAANLRVAETTKAMNVSLAETAATSDGALIAAQERLRTSSTLSATTVHGLIGEATGLTSALERVPTPVTVVAGALGKLAVQASVGGAAVAALSIDLAQKFQAASTLLHTQADVSSKDLAVLTSGWLKMAGAVATAPTELAEAGYHIASIGQNLLTTAQELGILKIAAEGAKLGGANLVDVTNALDAAVVSGIKGVSNYTQTMGVLNATVGAGDMSMQDLASAFGPLGAVLKGYNVTIQQAGAALATFGDNNIRGAQAGTQLRMAVQALADPTAAGAAQLRAWGLTAGNLASQMQQGGLTDALDVLMQTMRENGVTAQEQGDILTEVFGKRAGVGLAVLEGELDRFHNNLGEVGSGGQSFASSWSGYTKTFSYNLDAAKSAAESLGVQLGGEAPA